MNNIKVSRSIDLVVNFAQKQGYGVDRFTSKLSGKKRYYTVLTSKDGKGITFSDNQFTLPSDSRVARAFFTYKHLSYELAERCNIKTLDTIYLNSEVPYDHNELQRILNDCGQVIVKPDDGARGDGFTGDISDIEMLSSAIEAAKPYVSESKMILVQEQFFGEEARFVTIDGYVKGILLSVRPNVIGDGISTVAQLIAMNNKERDSINERVMIPYPYLTADNVPVELLESSRILEKNEKLYLNQSTATKNGALIYNATDTIHRSYVNIAERLSMRFGRGMICVDLFLSEPDKPANDSNYALVEMNEGMSLPMCYRCIDGNHFDIMGIFVAPLLKKILS